MFTLQRITTEYREDEDRVRLSAEVTADAIPGTMPGTISSAAPSDTTSSTILVLWLSQRLLLRLLPHVFNWLEQLPPLTTAPAGDQSTATARHTMADARTAELIQGFAQQSARHGIPAQPPVRPTANSAEQLVTAVDIKAVAAKLNLVFRSAAGEIAALSLEAPQLRQWLAILYTLWLQAEWPMAIWPQWMLDDSPATATEHKALH